MPRKSNRRELIINVATSRFLIAGYDSVTVDELCDLTSSTKGSFYHFFDNKEALAVDVVNNVWHQTESELTKTFVSEQSVQQKLRHEVERVSTGYVRFDGRRYFIGCSIGSLAVSLRGKSPKLTRRLNFALTHMRQIYRAAIADAIKSGELQSGVSADEAAFDFQLRLQGLSSLGKTQSTGSLVRELSDVIRHSIDKM